MDVREYLVLDVLYQDESGQFIKSVCSQYEELFSDIAKDKLNAYLLKLRREGWQFVYVHSLNNGQNEIYYFRRSTE